jgi:hypothetical protein
MKNLTSVFLAFLICGSFALSQDQSRVPERAPLLLIQEIPLPNVAGRIDHFTFDAKRKRVIGAALGNNTVEIVDTFAGRDIHSITGAADPQGVAFAGEFNKLFVANGTDGKLRIYDGETFSLLDTVDIGEDADNVRYFPAEKKVYVAYGGDEEGGIAVIDAATSKRLEDVAKLDAHPESFQIAASKPVIYANVATKAKVIVIDRNTHKVTDWPLKIGKANYPMALDETIPTMCTTTPGANVFTPPAARASSLLSNKSTPITTSNWGRSRPQPGHALACGMRNETGSIWLCQQHRSRVPLCGFTLLKIEWKR